jgi:putative Holliday junction resolvase
MARILALDYGKKRTGIAVTDPLQMIASPLTTVDTQELFEFLKDYVNKEPVEKILIGLPLNLDGTDTDATAAVRHNIRRLKRSQSNPWMNSTVQRKRRRQWWKWG